MSNALEPRDHNARIAHIPITVLPERMMAMMTRISARFTPSAWPAPELPVPDAAAVSAVFLHGSFVKTNRMRAELFQG